MAFVKTHWVDDSEPAITAAQLNRIEDGIAEAGESSKAIVLTQAEYDALSDEEKDSDNVYYISDAPFESSNVVPLTRAEYDALSDATKMDGRFYYITDEAEVAKSLVVQNNVNSTETVPSSAVVYGLKSEIDNSLNGKQNSIRQISVDLSGLSVTTPDSGWYYAEYSIASLVPSNAKLLSIQVAGGWDASVFYYLNITTTSILVRSPASKTLGNNRKAVVYYYV